MNVNVSNGYNPMILCDFYKIAHRICYKEGTESIYSMLVGRNNKYLPVADKIVAFGFQKFVKEYLIEYFNLNFFNRDKDEIVNEYKLIIGLSLGIPLEKVDTSHIEELHNLGFLPLRLSAVKEGTLVPFQVPVLIVENTLPNFFWLTNYIETLLSAELWHSMTSATKARSIRKVMDKYALKTTGSTDGVDFQGHDFSMRGMSGLYSGINSGMAHLLFYKGTDTIPAIQGHMKYYNADIHKELVGTSINAMEHSVMSSLTPADGDRDEYQAFKHIITEVYPEGFVSIVSDTYDFDRVVGETLPRLKNEIMSRNGRVVVRPDCYDENTKILTKSGWKYFKDLNENDLVAQVLDNGNYTFVKPLRYINQFYKGKMCHFKDHYGKIDLLVTPNHRMILSQKNTRTGIVTERIIEAEQLKKKGHHNQHMFRSAKALSNGKKLSNIDRLKIAFQADGSFVTKGEGIRFAFSKERKMKRIEYLLNINNLSYKKYPLSDDRYEYVVKVKSSDFSKDFDWVDISNLEGNWCAEFVEELSHWDSTNRNEGKIQFNTTNKKVSEIVEYIVLSAGYGDLITVYKDDRKDIYNDCYVHNILKNNLVGGQSWKKEEVYYEGNIYCVQVPTGRLIVKRNSCTMVCGNSGDPVEVICGKYFIDLSNDKYVKTLEDVKDYFYDEVREDERTECGDGYFGDEQISFNVKYDNKYYKVTYEVEYNRHDKRYYYVDSVKFKSLTEVFPTTSELGLVESLWNTFGGEVNNLGYKVLDSHVGVIYGDSMNYERISEICRRLEEKGFASTNFVAGVGSYFYTGSVTRDSLGFAIKATHSVVNGKDVKLFKDPKTDVGKRSLKGRAVVYELDGEIVCKDNLTRDEEVQFIKENNIENLLLPLFENGKILREDSLKDIRLRVKGN